MQWIKYSKGAKDTVAKSKKQQELEQHVGELTQDLQRMRADFENYRKRVDTEKQQARESGRAQAVLQVLPVLDTLDRAIAHMPADLAGNSWAEGVLGLSKSVTKLMHEFDLTRITIAVNETEFDPALHEAVSADEGEGDRVIITEELQAGYQLGDRVVRPAMVRVTHK